MAKLLYIGAATGAFVTKKGKRLLVNKGTAYALEPADVKGHEDMFHTPQEHVEHLETQASFRAKAASRPVEQATAAPGEVREVTPPSAKTKAAPKKPAVKKTAPAKK